MATNLFYLMSAGHFVNIKTNPPLLAMLYIYISTPNFTYIINYDLIEKSSTDHIFLTLLGLIEGLASSGAVPLAGLDLCMDTVGNYPGRQIFSATNG